MALQYNPKIVTKGLVMNLDTADKNSYPGSGTTWTDLCGNGFNATLGSSVSFQTVHGGVLRTLNSETNFLVIWSRADFVSTREISAARFPEISPD